jgi:low affinity Fe/Cu permease
MTFSKFSQEMAKKLGHYSAFIIALMVVLVWLLCGPIFNFSDTWQLVINTGTTIVTFLMVFLLQHTQNRDTIAIQLKLDEIIRAIEPARNTLLKIEESTDEELEKLQKYYEDLALHVKGHRSKIET